MNFVLRMTARELRASSRRLFFFFLCISVGVTAIVALQSAIDVMRSVFAGEARTLLGGDVVLSSSAPLPEPQAQRVDARVGAASGRRIAAVDLATMVRAAANPDGNSRMVELRAVEAGFPLYGELRLRDGLSFSEGLLRDRGVLVRPELLEQLGVARGDTLLIGTQRFTIRGVVESEPGRRIGAFSLGPRVFIGLPDLQHTGLLDRGSRATHHRFIQLPAASLEATVAGLNADLRGSLARIRSLSSMEGEIGDNFGRAERYLGLVGLVILILGGIGVSSVVRVFVQQKIRSVAVLKCVGARSSQLLAIYTLQALLLGAAGSALGIVGAAAALRAVPDSLWATAAPGMRMPALAVTLPAALQGFALGLLVSMAFAIVPLLEIRRVKPSLLLRDVDARPERDPLRWLMAVAVSAVLTSVAIWQAGSVQLGTMVAVAVLVTGIVLHFSGAGLIRALSPLARVQWFPLRHAVLKLIRPGNQTRLVLLAVGLGSFLTLGVRSLQELLLSDLSVDLQADAPDMFLLDLQGDQVAPLHDVLRKHREPKAPPERVIPILRARVTGIEGRTVRLEDYEDVRERGSLGREYTITYRNRLERNERILSGRFWDNTPSNEGEVSIEQSLQERHGIGLGDTIRFDVLGRSIKARVTSVRSVNWTDARAGGFMFVFRPGLLDRAPHTYVGFLRGPGDATARARLQNDVLAALPNVSVIDGREMLGTLRRIVDTISLAVNAVGSLVVLSGMLILIGAVMMTKYRRAYDVSIFKTLGATRRMIFTALLLEYSALGAVAGCVGAIAATALTFGISRFAFELPFRPMPGLSAVGVAVCAALVGTVGVAASAGVLRRKPLATLKGE